MGACGSRRTTGTPRRLAQPYGPCSGGVRLAGESLDRSSAGDLMMQMEVFEDEVAVARRAAAVIVENARHAVSQRGKFVMAVSGGKTPWVMLRDLADEQLPWGKVHVFQIDERIAPAGDRDRNLTHLPESLLEHAPLPSGHIYAMPVEEADIEGAASNYAR